MSFDDEVREPPSSSWALPRFVAGPFDAQDAAARAAGLSWSEWARQELERAAAGSIDAAPAMPVIPRRLAGAARGP